MFFISMACMDENANKYLKGVLSIFPPVNLELGIILIGKFQSNFKNFHLDDYFKTYTNYSVFTMNLMQVIDFLLYLFLGYYLQNVIPHEFGIRRPLYFICTKEYWCGSSNKNITQKKKEINEIINKIEIDANTHFEEGKNSENPNIEKNSSKKKKKLKK